MTGVHVNAVIDLDTGDETGITFLVDAVDAEGQITYTSMTMARAVAARLWGLLGDELQKGTR